MARRNLLLGLMVTPSERELAHAVAARERRTLSDVVRLMLRERAYQLGIVEVEQAEERPGQSRAA